jgi:ubiquinone/menaquinone biosynthesis C-methylase UbiE
MRALSFSKWIQSLNLARSGVYFLESLPLTLVSRFLTHPELEPIRDEQVRLVWKHIGALYEREARELEKGSYSWRVLELENPWQHLRSFAEVLSDGVRVAWRMKHKHTKVSPELDQEGLPEYYTRNFHFQTDGYLSEASARRYDHQVEILFSGTAASMRRLILPVLKQFTGGEGRFLELGSGTGSATRQVLRAFPRAKVTALDLSAPYLKVAQDNLRAFRKVDFVQGDATELDFRENTFDAVYSVYVMHELPARERELLVREAFRVLKPGGVLLLADSLQWDDEPELNWALERFPKVYHEPFYKNYLHDHMDQLLTRVTGCAASSDHAFLTRLAWIQKPISA